MAKKTPTTLRVISTLFIIYGLLDIGQLFMPVETKDTIEYSAPLLGIFLLLFGAGMFFSKEWARQGSVFGCVYAIILSLLGMRHSSDFELILNLVFIGIFGITFWYLTRPSIKAYFSKTPPLKIHFHCPDCQTKYSALPEQSGKEGSCKNCGARIVVPEPEHNSTSPKTGLDGVSKSSNQLQVFLHLFSGLSGVLIIAIDLIFAAWAVVVNHGTCIYLTSHCFLSQAVQSIPTIFKD